MLMQESEFPGGDPHQPAPMAALKYILVSAKTNPFLTAQVDTGTLKDLQRQVMHVNFESFTLENRNLLFLF